MNVRVVIYDDNNVIEIIEKSKLSRSDYEKIDKLLMFSTKRHVQIYFV